MTKSHPFIVKRGGESVFPLLYDAKLLSVFVLRWETEYNETLIVIGDGATDESQIFYYLRNIYEYFLQSLLQSHLTFV